MKTGSNFFSTTAGVVCTGLVLGALSGALNCWLLSLALWLLSMLSDGHIEILRSAVLGKSAIYSLLAGFNPFVIHY